MDGATRRRSCGLHYLYQRAAPTPSWSSLGHPLLLPAVPPRLLAAASAHRHHPSRGAGGRRRAALDGGGGGAADTALEGTGPITLVQGKDTSGFLQEILDDWNARNPDQTVTLIELPESADAQRQQMIQNAQAQSDAYDVLSVDNVWTAEFAANRYIVELPEDQFPVADMLPPVIDSARYLDKLYAVPSGGAPVWTESQNAVAVSNGLFKTELGSITALPAGLFDGKTYYLGTSVGTDPEMVPRLTLTAQAYAMNAKDAEIRRTS